MFGGNGYAPSAAPYPNVNYPASAFFGAQSLMPSGAQERAPGTSPQQRTHMLIFILLLVVVGYAAWHWNFSR